MPVGKVFNAAENQILISPVTSYYQGKAIRQQQEEKEVDIAQKKKTLEQSDEKFELEKQRGELQKKEIEIREQNYGLNRDRFENEVGKERALRAAFDLYGITKDVNKVFQDGDKSPEAEAASLELAAQRIAEYADNLPDGESKSKLLEMLKDGISADEYRSILAASDSNVDFYGLDKSDVRILGDGDQMYVDGELVAENPKDAAPKPQFDPPNKAELESANELIKTSEKLDDLSSSETKIAKMILANDIRQLQERFEIPYDQAAALAIKELEKKVRLEPDFFTGTDSFLALGDNELAENEYLGVDGKVYVMGEDGEFRARD